MYLQIHVLIMFLDKPWHKYLLSSTDCIHLAAKLHHKDIFAGPLPQQIVAVAPSGGKESPSRGKYYGSSRPEYTSDSESGMEN